MTGRQNYTVFRRAPEPHAGSWSAEIADGGVSLMPSASNGARAIEPQVIGGYMTQLLDDSLAIEVGNGLFVSWDNVFEIRERVGYAYLLGLLGLPGETVARMSIRSQGSLTDSTFAILVSEWRGVDGKLFVAPIVGAVIERDGERELLRPAQWQLYRAVTEFARRTADERTERHHREYWGRIRRLAVAADADMDAFLANTIVLTPEKLQIGLRRSEHLGDDSVIEIEPSFDGAPVGWLAAFDRSSKVLSRYDIAAKSGIVQVLVSQKVGTVLNEIKKLPGRRVAGARAQAFILNPFATLGDDASDVIVAEQFEEARHAAGIAYERFVPKIERDDAGFPVRVGILIEIASAVGPLSSEERWLSDDELGHFIGRLERGVAKNHQLVVWEGFEFEVPGEISEYLDTLRLALKTRRQPRVLVSHAQVHDLRLYSSRISGIGIEKPYYSPYIAKRNDEEGWFPENVIPVITFQPAANVESVAIPTDSKSLEELRAAAEKARTDGQSHVTVPWLPTPIALTEAEVICKTFVDVMDDLGRQKGDPSGSTIWDAVANQRKKSLVLRPNIESIDYEEHRREALLAVSSAPRLPKSLRPDCTLYPHQKSGLAWLQHLVDSSKLLQVRGAVFADDMGLGKTLQLLALFAWMLERDPGLDPILVVAPVSLLENWQEEVTKFFQPQSLPVLIAYGEALASLRVPRTQIDERLRTEDGLVKFLKPGWIGSAKIVLTTYETLRDLEFSFALTPWSMMVCDEAQRIKNPAAMVTRAAKKQNVRFKIACTGTPVENTLADLWCLFDFVQPGLLGALNDFGQRYRKPIEARTEEEKARVEELRARIAPQILRRTKREVARELPQKIEDLECRKLPISDVQRSLYAKALLDFKTRGEVGSVSPFKNHLGLLQYLRLICTDPRRHGLGVFTPSPLAEYRKKAPKLGWLLEQLARIRSQGEKAIIFCEFRSIQRLLQHYIQAELSYKPDIINGETSASSTSATSRQKRLHAFQLEPGFGVIILSPLAVGFGVNIQAANHVIHYTRTWNPAKEDQATDRAYRIGQTKDVRVYYPVVVANDFTTFDVKLDNLLAHKRALAEDMLNGAGDVGPGDFDIADVVPQGETEGLDEQVTLDVALRMEWNYLECLASLLWAKQRFVCYRTPMSKDNGVDIVATRDGEGALIQVKSSGTAGVQLNWDAVKEVVAGAAYYQRIHPRVVFSKIALTNQFFNKQATELAQLNDVTLVDQKLLGELLLAYPTTMLEVERELFGKWSDAQDDAA